MNPEISKFHRDMLKFTNDGKDIDIELRGKDRPMIVTDLIEEDNANNLLKKMQRILPDSADMKVVKSSSGKGYRVEIYNPEVIYKESFNIIAAKLNEQLADRSLEWRVNKLGTNKSKDFLILTGYAKRSLYKPYSPDTADDRVSLEQVSEYLEQLPFEVNHESYKRRGNWFFSECSFDTFAKIIDANKIMNINSAKREYYLTMVAISKDNPLALGGPGTPILNQLLPDDMSEAEIQAIRVEVEKEVIKHNEVRAKREPSPAEIKEKLSGTKEAAANSKEYDPETAEKGKERVLK